MIFTPTCQANSCNFPLCDPGLLPLSFILHPSAFHCGSSHWIHTEFPAQSKFAWQDGYGVFSVSRSHANKVIEYIQNQRRHHQHQSFEDEYAELLTLHEIEYDERYLFG